MNHVRAAVCEFAKDFRAIVGHAPPRNGTVRQGSARESAHLPAQCLSASGTRSGLL